MTATASLLDYVLVAVLLVLLPAYNLRRSLTTAKRPKLSKEAGYWRSMAIALGLSACVGAFWLLNNRSSAELGLGLPLSLPGLIGMIVSASVLTIMALILVFSKKRPELPSKGDASALFPDTDREFHLFLVTAVTVSFCWELLYRGFLLWALTPTCGTVVAVIVSAAAYGLAHGWKGTRALVGSLVAALIFTVAYALTKSLWWLMFLHAGLPVVGGLGMRLQAKRIAVRLERAKEIPGAPD